MRSRSEDRDPIHRWFFNDHKGKEASTIDKFVATQQRYIDESQRERELLALNDTKPPVKKLADRSKQPKRQSLLDLVGDEGVLA